MKYETQNYALPPQMRKQFFETEKQIFNRDCAILELKALKNELEAYSYEMRNNLDSYGSLEKFCEQPQREQLIKMANETVDWLYGDG